MYDSGVPEPADDSDMDGDGPRSREETEEARQRVPEELPLRLLPPFSREYLLSLVCSANQTDQMKSLLYHSFTLSSLRRGWTSMPRSSAQVQYFSLQSTTHYDRFRA